MSNTVPSGWSLQPLSALANYYNGRAFKPEDWSTEGLPIIRIAQITNENADLDYYAGDDVSDKNRIQNGDLLFSWSATLTALIWNRGDAVLNQHIFKVEEKEAVDRSFLHQVILNSIEPLADYSHGSTMKHIKKGVLDEYLVLTPPLPEQQKIAAILSSVDDVIEKTRAQIDKLKDLKTGMMQELLTKGIGHTEFKDSPVGRIPIGWKHQFLEEVATIQTGVAKSRKTTGDLIDVPYLRVANVQDGYLDLSEVKTIQIDRSRLERFLLRDQDVLVNEGGDFDKLGRGFIWRNQVEPCIHQNHVFVVRTNQKVLIPMYFNYLSGSQYGKQYYLGCAKQTTNLASLNSSQLKKFPVLLPPLEEQREICKVLESMDTKIERVERRLNNYENLKKSLMQDLLTGKVRVKLDNNEPPAASTRSADSPEKQQYDHAEQ